MSERRFFGQPGGMNPPPGETGAKPAELVISLAEPERAVLLAALERWKQADWRPVFLDAKESLSERQKQVLLPLLRHVRLTLAGEGEVSQLEVHPGEPILAEELVALYRVFAPHFTFRELHKEGA